MSVRCIGLAGLLYGHRIEHVITKGPSTMKGLSGITKSSEAFVENLFEMHRPQTYEGSMCRRCGMIFGYKDSK